MREEKKSHQLQWIQKWRFSWGKKIQHTFAANYSGYIINLGPILCRGKKEKKKAFWTGTPETQPKTNGPSIAFRGLTTWHADILKNRKCRLCTVVNVAESSSTCLTCLPLLGISNLIEPTTDTCSELQAFRSQMEHFSCFLPLCIVQIWILRFPNYFIPLHCLKVLQSHVNNENKHCKRNGNRFS